MKKNPDVEYEWPLLYKGPGDTKWYVSYLYHTTRSQARAACKLQKKNYPTYKFKITKRINYSESYRRKHS